MIFGPQLIYRKRNLIVFGLVFVLIFGCVIVAQFGDKIEEVKKQLFPRTDIVVYNDSQYNYSITLQKDWSFSKEVNKIKSESSDKRGRIEVHVIAFTQKTIDEGLCADLQDYFRQNFAGSATEKNSFTFYFYKDALNNPGCRGENQIASGKMKYLALTNSKSKLIYLLLATSANSNYDNLINDSLDSFHIEQD